MLTVQVITAVKLPSATITKIKERVEDKYKTDAQIVEVVKPNVIGGISLTIGSDQFDSTLKNKLFKIKNQLDQNL